MRSARTIVAVIATMLALPGSVTAHAALVETSPAAGSRLDEPPTEVVVTFDGELEPGGSGFVVTDAEGTEIGDGTVDLDVAERNVLRGTIDVETEGRYTVSWTAASIDGHTETGSFTFDVGTASSQSPDTAHARPTSRPLVPLGALLVALAAAIVLRGRRLGSPDDA